MKGGKVNRDVSIKNWEDHRDVAYGSARVATVEIRKALQVRRVRAGHDEVRGGKEVTSKAVEVRSDGFFTAHGFDKKKSKRQPRHRSIEQMKGGLPQAPPTSGEAAHRHTTRQPRGTAHSGHKYF